MDNRLLGIAKKAGFLEIGEESVATAARNKKAKVILSAADASDGSKRRAHAYAEQYNIIYLVLPSTKEDLGAVVGRGAPGMLAILDAGIASRYADMLARLEPGRYDTEAETLSKMAQRVLQRRREARAHDRNKRTGKRRTGQ
ncbi:ribosomal L7Ae/L30e/S12e/Gadd45 family protein [Oscillospiraceae bacterium CM]|nr:ribosomal L7Ae/L30e/S12e/Gadd45 family protein [Oscillospiraceae bacterium CM]